MDRVESDIYSAIDMAFNWFKKHNQSLELICDKETMSQWHEFVKWCYAQDGEEHAEYKIAEFKKENNPDFDFEISPLMESAMQECSAWWCKYNVDHQFEAMELMRAEMDHGEDYDYEEDPDQFYWEYYEEAFNKISKSIDTKGFKQLSMISIKDKE